MAITNDLLLRVLAGEKTARPPVWLMRQAGRILPEYRKVRASVDGFKALVSNPSLAAEVTVQPVEILDVDAAIIFSDILVIPECMGLDYELIEKVGPRFPKTIEKRQDIEGLISGDDAACNLQYVYDALGETKRRLEDNVPLIGFSGAPWTLLSYMIEGGGSKTFSKAKAFLFGQPRLAHLLLEKITETIIAYLRRKIDSGADVLQLFDSWAGVLDRETYAEYGIRYIEEIVESLEGVPLIIFSKGAWFSYNDLAKLGVNAYGLDWQITPEQARNVFGPDTILQGNLDPSRLLANPESIAQNAEKMLNNFGPLHIANLGHGVYPNTPLENVKVFINTVKSYSY